MLRIPDTRADADACVRLRLSPRQLEGWAPRTFFERDEQGRLASSWTEPLYDRMDSLIMRVHLANEAGRCRCGGYLDETTKPDHGYRIEASTCYRCRAEIVWHEKQDKIDELMKHTRDAPYPGARVLSVEAIPPPPPEDD